MKRHLDALTRIGRLQALMHDVGRWRLHSLERRQAGLNDDLKAVFETLEADEIAYGGQGGLVARRIRALQLRLDQQVKGSFPCALTIKHMRQIKDSGRFGTCAGYPIRKLFVGTILGTFCLPLRPRNPTGGKSCKP